VSILTRFSRRRTGVPTTLLQAPAPPADAETVSIPVQDGTGPRPVAAQDIRVGEWDTPEERAEVAAIFGPDNRGTAERIDTPEMLAELQRQAAILAAADAGQAPETPRIPQYAAAAETRIDLPAVCVPPVSACECYGLMELAVYPPWTSPGGSREQYAAFLRWVGEITGTRTREEAEGAWPWARSVPLARITADGLAVLGEPVADEPAPAQHRPLLALCAGTGAA
jgi:hypothetical protein